jgi:glycosyltransferase involved in cell wall biosynthesis
MRVLHVSQPVDAGVARVVVDLVADQVARGWDVAVACPAEGWLPEAARKAGARVAPWSATRSPGPRTVAEAQALSKIVDEFTPAVVHLHSAKAGLAGRLAVRGRLPTVFQPHAWSFEAVDGVMRVASQWWERVGAGWSDLVVAVSDSERSRGGDAGIRTPVFVARNGVDPDRWRPGNRAAARTSLGLGDGPLIVCVGRLTRQKGQDRLIALWPEVRAAVPGASLVLVGDGPDRTVLEAAAGPGVVFAGATDDPEPWYAAADVVVVASRWEGMALVPLEAMACERSVVATDVDGVRETLGLEAGAVVPADDGEALRAALVRRLTDPEMAGREGRAGRARVVSWFNVWKTTAAVADAVERLVHERRRPPALPEDLGTRRRA